LKPRIKPLGSSPYSFFQFPLLGLTF